MKMPTEPRWLRAALAGAPVGVDRDNRVIHGYVVAQEGPFKTPGRGEFDLKSLKEIVRLMKAAGPSGLRSRFTHPNESNDGLGKLLGHAKAPRLDQVQVRREGELVTLAAVRADLHLSPTAFESNPNGNLGEYVLDLAEAHPESVASSLVLRANEEFRRKKDGTLELDEEGRPLPPLWRPTLLRATDIVDTGDAVDGLLSAGPGADGLLAALEQALGGTGLGAVRRTRLAALAGHALDTAFAGESREVVEARCRAWLDLYLSLRFGELIEPLESCQDMAALERRQRLREKRRR